MTTRAVDAQSAKARGRASRTSGRLLDLDAAEAYSGISAWTLRDLFASGDLPAVRPPRLRSVWIDRELRDMLQRQRALTDDL